MGTSNSDSDGNGEGDGASVNASNALWWRVLAVDKNTDTAKPHSICQLYCALLSKWRYWSSYSKDNIN